MIAFIGVVAVARSTIAANTKAHKDRLQRESIADRRAAFADLLATWMERPVADGKVKDASERLRLISEAINENGGRLDAATVEKNLQLHDAHMVAVQERDQVIGRLVVHRIMALASVTDERSPLPLVVGLTNLPDGSLTPAMFETFVEAMRADQVMDERERRAREERVRDMVQPFAAAMIEAGMNPASSPLVEWNEDSDDEGA